MSDSPPPTPEYTADLNVSPILGTVALLLILSLKDVLDDDTSVAVESLLRISNTSRQWIPPSPISTISDNGSPTTCTEEPRAPVTRDVCSVTTLGSKQNSSSPGEEVILRCVHDIIM